ncbi:O-phosphoserine--tRNA ligase [Methanobacterium aggregans]|uniref:O-phosphoserine--tRNA ligase n=1 Tax=Methanobacterium aggregans TaxID=1615586 RepID=UPI001AE7F4D7|nr:O-phosphoserine--tRNA ligase [Methanobacterium aggregans]MBP2046062.1 O-phosphoseryl-tRNA synthetase [Methanobacterium aggregans]
MKRKEIVRLAKRDFEKAWIETAKTLKKPHHDQEYPRLHFKTGKSHMLYDTIAELRQAYMKLGFDETVNPVFIDEEQIYKQFGPEAPAVLDRCFYLAGLPRPDIGIGMDKIERIEGLGVKLTEEKVQGLKDVFRGYKKGDTSGDDLVLEVSSALDVENDLGLRVLERVFPELRELTPVANQTTLRSHMTSGWFVTLSSIHDKTKLPLKLFSIDRCFRREQREDSSHLMTYHSASCVWMDDEVSLDVGMAVSESLLEHFGFEKFRFQPDEKKSKYYVPGTQTEVYGYHPKLREWVEVATFGMYSPIALAKYGIDKDVMNLGVGAERIAMILHNQADVREMVYPQTYGSWSFTDRELATMLRINYYPATTDGRALMNSILETWTENGDADSPCEFTVFKGEFLGKDIEVVAVEPESGTKLLGPASMNSIHIQDGNIIGVPEGGDVQDEAALKAVENGVNTNIRYINGLAANAAYKIEEMVVSGAEEVSLRTTISRSISDINLRLDEVALNYITGKNKVIDVRGPTFSTLNCKIIE